MPGIGLVALLLAFLIVVAIFLYKFSKEERRETELQQAKIEYEELSEEATDAIKLDGIPIYVMTMPQFQGRIQFMERQFEKLGYQNYEFLYGVPKEKITSHLFPDGLRRKVRYPPEERPVIVAHAVSYVSNLMYFLQSKESHVLILEDDASLVLISRWSRSINQMIQDAPEDTDVISLLNYQMPSGPKGVYHKWSPNGFSCGGWIFNRKAAQKVLDFLVSPSEIDLTKLLPEIVVDRSFPTFLNVYSTDEWCVIDWNNSEEVAPQINPTHLDMKNSIICKVLLEARNKT